MKQITLGIVGGGQLGRMSALSASRLGIQTVIFTPEEHSPASQVAARTIIAPYDDEGALARFADHVDFITYEFENIPLETVAFLKKLKPVYPDEKLLEVSQDRIKEKAFLNEIGIPTAPWAPATSPEEIGRVLQEWNADKCILKTTRFGYDGKGQAFIEGTRNINDAFRNFNNAPLIMEGVVDFSCEISVIVARDSNGKTEAYGPMLNEHKNHILHKTFVPVTIPEAQKDEALTLARTLAEKVNLRGVLTLELFVTKDAKILANEIAPRTHNSGHWTIDACAVSQFENHVRTVCGLPAGNTQPHSDVEMLNLIGEDAANTQKYLEQENTCLHLYGKQNIRAGRKMGHVTFLKRKELNNHDTNTHRI